MIAALGITFAISAALFLALWVVSLVSKDPSFVDAWWGLGVVVLAWVSFLQGTHAAHGLTLAMLATAWGLRLGLFLLWRWRGHGKDRRYAGLEQSAAAKGLGFASFAVLWVFGPQMLLQFVVALPVMLGQFSQRDSLGALAWCGAALATFGILYEAIADQQLSAFKADPANAGKVMDRGLWRYSRHPNYFGELCVWWGLYMIAADAGYALWAAPSPLLVTFLLARVSGAPTTEPHLRKTRPEYEAYRQRTSAFAPWPPKR